MKSKEYYKSSYKVAFEGDVLNIIFTKAQTTKEDHIQLANLVTIDALKMVINHPNSKVNVLVHLNLDAFPVSLPRRAKLSYLGFSLNSQVNRVAIVGNRNQIMNFPEKFFLWLIRLNNKVYWFDNVQTAEDWLKQ